MKYLRCVALVFVCLIAGFTGNLLTRASVKTWYPTLNKPSWNPPDWVFAPVWTSLFICIAIAGWLVFEKKNYRSREMVLFVIQLILNITWSLCFFYLQNPGLAFVEILILLTFIGITTVSFIKVNLYAGLLFTAYFLWVAFASALNYTIWSLN